MAFDKPTRNRLASFVSEARNLITDEFRQQLQSIYGISEKGTITPLDQLRDLDDAGRSLATLLRERIEYLVRTHPDDKDDTKAAKAAVDRLAREQAFTVLNRLAAVRMAEKRDLVVESVGKGYQSKGFKVFEQVAGSALGDTYQRYRRYLFCLFDELAVDLGVLFDRRSPQGLLFPRESALQELLKLLNAPDLEALWIEDETIGWIYQYYNDPAERKKMRDESAAPRNSRELAVRNQFFTPRYVVEFLTDNTLGRIWYEMTQGQTRLQEQCRYLVRRPTEIFLNPGDAIPDTPPQDGLSQEELLKQPVHIAHRSLKDPRAIRMLDPACGSMHFGLYAFELFEVIYEEAWEIAHGPDEARKSSASFVPFVSFVRQYPDKAAFLADVPRLIIEHNLHGIDIDPRAAQIAGLSLWLRAQRTWQQQRLRPQDRPRIRRSNIVCAEPMPGDVAFLDEFTTAHLSATPEDKLLGQLVRRVFDAMKLAGEAGSLLKIEEEIAGAVAEAKQKWLARPKMEQGRLFADDTALAVQMELDLNVTGITDETFWEKAEERIYAALQAYAEQTEHSGGYQRRLFADDAARGFAFIDLCRQHYDVVLMNPPFGDASLPSKPYLDETYGDTKGDVYKAFVECFQVRLVPAGYLGIISSRSGFFLGQSEDWRTRVVLRLFRPIALADLGSGVLDAMVEVAAYVLRSLSESEARDLTLLLVPALNQVMLDRQERFSLPKWQAARDGLKRHQAVAELEHLEGAGFIARCPGAIVRYIPLWKAVKEVNATLKPMFPLMACIRVLDVIDKGVVIAGVVDLLGTGHTASAVFIVDPADFYKVPGTPFSYWAGNAARSAFSTLPVVQSEDRKACVGLSTKDDVRFIRLRWEVDCSETGRRWFCLVKGGAFARFYSDPHLVLDWEEDGRRLKTFAEQRTTQIFGVPSWSRWINNWDTYFRPGINWSRRSQRGLSLRAFPEGCIYSDKAPVIFDEVERLPVLLALTNSLPFQRLVELQMAFGSYEVGVIQKTPLPDLSIDQGIQLGSLSYKAWRERCSTDTAHSTSHAFIVPALLALPGETLAVRATAWAARVRTSEEAVTAIQAEIDDLAFRLYGFDDTDRAALTSTLATETSGDAEADEDEEEEEAAITDATGFTADLLAYTLGAAFGRWDIQFATGEKAAPELPNPFAPLPVCPPGQLQNEQGLPITKEEVDRLKEEGQWNCPIEIPWEGILVDDPGHPLDIEARVHHVLQIIWKDRWEAIEHEACEILGVKSLRDYFRKPAGFFADHLKRYSKSRRQAPIYWPLSTASGGYTLWIYYHRLTENTLHTALADFIDPKLRSVRAEISALRESGARRDRLEELQDLEKELEDFRAEIERIIKLPWKPNLNDGVLITASPLWKLFRLLKWQKDLKACWEELSKGDYDWAHLAYVIWPKRVEEVCKTDRSIAIAHDLEHLCIIQALKPKVKRGKKNAAL